MPAESPLIGQKKHVTKLFLQHLYDIAEENNV